MFTGLVETMGRVVRVTRGKGSTRLAIESTLPAAKMRDGESVAVDGVCLTVARRRGRVLEMDAVPETLALTTLGDLRTGDPVHLERALTLADRLGGHLVQGHVDGVARVISLTSRAGDVRLAVELPAALRRYAAVKGSIALHGVSLTVARRTARGVEVALIPETLARTKLGAVRAGFRLNVEMDLIARYLDALSRERR
ncbi:MAG TPA: riboflavin synthase [Candidatus Binatia bacterium]|nr:riboflavin synthase [Candidatus Binatia bacterium]